VYIRCHFDYSPYRSWKECDLYSHGKHIATLNPKAVRSIISKQVERIEREEERRRLEREIWDFTEGKLFYDPMDDTLRLINSLMGGKRGG